MADVVFVALTAAFFALATSLVYACDRIIGPDETDATASEPVGDERIPEVIAR